MKKLFAIILGTSMIFAFAFVARGEEVTECKHTNMTTTVEEQAADCTHTYYRYVTSVCKDCGYRTFEVTKGSAYQHGPIKFVDNSTPATCMEQGWLCWSYVCTLCGEKVGGGIQPIAKIEHAVDAGGYPTCYSGCAVQYQSTCTEHGYYESTVWCLQCNCIVSHVKEELPLADHNWSA